MRRQTGNGKGTQMTTPEQSDTKMAETQNWLRYNNNLAKNNVKKTNKTLKLIV
eukprot:m.2284 g.2284  ORF g.2284 m.2284 type:complete len:53 (+) comp8546_c0_seq1:81-239(+)